MATADLSVYSDVLKEVWTSDRLEKQFYDKNILLDSLEKTSKYTIGGKASVPVHLGRSGGYSAVPKAGTNSLNPASPQRPGKAEYDYTRHWHQIEIETGAIEQTQGNSNAVASVVDTEVNGGLDDLRHQLAAQAYLDGSGNICACGTTTSDTEVVLGVGGEWAISRNVLYEGLTIDIGTTADEDSVASDRQITAVDPVAGTITISGAAVTTSSSHRISIANSRENAASFTMNGLANIIGTGSLGGIDGSTERAWRGNVDTTNDDLSLPLLLKLQRSVLQATGDSPDWNVTSTLQQLNFYSQLQQQVRFGGDSGIGAGDPNAPTWAGMKVDAQPDCPDEKWHMLTKKNLFMVRLEKPKWVNQAHGGGGILVWKQGSTKMLGAVLYFANLATDKRNAHGVLSNLKTDILGV